VTGRCSNCSTSCASRFPESRSSSRPADGPVRAGLALDHRLPAQPLLRDAARHRRLHDRLIAPTATHRLRFHRNERAYIIESANKLLIAGLFFLALAIMGAVVLITDYLFDGAAVWGYPVALAGLLAVLWFLRPMARGGKSSGP
jgi:hypothetical protein